MRSIYLFLTALFFLLVALLFGSSCASIVPPAGGPRDSLPPYLVKATPRDSTLNFRGNKIELQFNEYIDLQDVQNNLLFTPLFEQNPRVEVKGKNISIHFRDTLSPNTTYILNFGNALKDYNEGNVLRNFTYTFSTGPTLDSLELAGKVLLAENGKVDTTLAVVLHRDLRDSAVFLRKPQYVARVDANGNFRFRNLPAGTFAIYAIGNGGTDRKYYNSNQVFAFADKPVQAGVIDSALVLYAYKEAGTNTTTAVGGGGLNPLGRGGNAANRLVFSTNLSNGQQDLMTHLQINFATPVKNFDSSKLILSTDSTFDKKAYTFSFDSTRKQLTLKTAWAENRRYNLQLDKDFASDTAGRKLLKSDTLVFRTRKSEDYGAVSIRLKNVDLKRNPVLLLVQNDQVVLSVPVPNGVFTRERFLPGDYELRILYDTNGNGKWDPGKFFNARRQPEIVVPIAQKITIKADWNNEFER